VVKHVLSIHKTTPPLKKHTPGTTSSNFDVLKVCSSLQDSQKVFQELSYFLAQSTTPPPSLKKKRKKGFRGSLYRILLWVN
jgi:hypothetical protein